MSCSTMISALVRLISSTSSAVLLPSSVRHPAAGSSRQDQFGVGGQHKAKFDPLPLSMGKLADQAPAASVRPTRSNISFDGVLCLLSRC